MSKSSDAGGSLRADTRRAVPSVEPRAQSPEIHETGRPNREAVPSRDGLPRRNRLTIGNMALLLFAVTTAAVGQVMLKRGMQIASTRAAGSGGSLAVSAATSSWVLLGLVVFGISAVAWLAALSRVPLSVAYPFNALGYLGILAASVLLLHERANVLTWMGSLMVVSGLIIVVLARP
jgi:drug/metabolite transporter (DMT)-like permease